MACENLDRIHLYPNIIYTYIRETFQMLFHSDTIGFVKQLEFTEQGNKY